MMRAARYYEHGGPETIRIEQAPEPHAGEGAIRIRTDAVSVNPADWKIRRGDIRGLMPLPFPIIPGRDAAGSVDEIGIGVEGVALGDVVFGLGGVSDTYAEFAVLTAWAHVPATWTMEQAAAAGLAAATSLRALEAISPLSGMTILVEGAAGAVGSAVVAFAVDRGARVIGTARTADHSLLAEGGAVPVEYGPGIRARVAAVAPEGIGAAVDAAGAGSLPDLVAMVGKAQRVVTVADFAKASELGVLIANAENDSALMRQAADLGARNGYTPRVALVLPLEDAARAHAIAEKGEVRGKIVLRIS